MSVLQNLELDIDPVMQVALEEIARREWILEQLQAQKEQEDFARACRETNALEGIGAVTRMIHPAPYHDWALKLGSYDCWKDKGFNKYIDRIAPETKPVSRGAKCGGGLALQVGFTGSGNKRFTKNYGAPLPLPFPQGGEGETA